MKKAFYYLRKLTGEGVHPYACVCVVEDDGMIARGIAVCSPFDHFSKEIGRNKALGYAIRGLKSPDVQIEKRSNVAGQIIDNILNSGIKAIFPAVDTIKGKKKGKYLQSSALKINSAQIRIGVPESFIPLTEFEKKLLEN